MCEPVTIGLMTAALVGGLATAYGQVQEGEYAKQAGREQQRVLQVQAYQELDAAEIEADKVAREGGRLQGRQRVALAKNNADLGGELAYDLLAETELTQQFERNMILVNARNRAQALHVQGRIAREGGAQAKSASYIAAAGTLLQSVGAAGQAYQYGRVPTASRELPGSLSTGTYRTPGITPAANAY